MHSDKHPETRIDLFVAEPFDRSPIMANENPPDAAAARHEHNLLPERCRCYGIGNSCTALYTSPDYRGW